MKKSLLTAKNLLKKYKWNSIFVKYLIYTFCFFILPSIMICLFFFNSYSTALERDALSQAEQNAQKCFASVNDITTQITGIYSILSTDSDVTAYILSNSAEFKKRKEFSHYNNISRLLKYSLQYSSVIDSIDIYSLSNGYVLSTGNSNYYDNYTEKEKFEPFTKDNKLVYCIQSGFSHGTQTYNSVTFGYAIILNHSPAGLITITVDCNNLNKILASGEKENVMLFDNKSRNIIFSSNLNYSENLPADFELDNIKKYPAFSTSKNNAVISCISNIMPGLDIICNSDINSLKENNKKFLTIGLILLLFAILIPLFMSLYSSFLIYNSIIKITSVIHTEIKTEDKNSFNEIEFISNNLLNITKEKQDIESHLAKNLSTLKATQATALQMQISPHFLFNTLNVVSMIIMDTVKGENDAQKVLALLSSFLNDILSSNETVTTLSDEIKNLNKYIEIELIKSNYDFDVIWESEEESLDVRTVKFILQPIVENALSHGIKPVEDLHGIIKIKSEIIDKNLVITVSNNGMPIAPKKLDEIRKKLLFDDMPKNHIGLYNVNQRIKIIFGDDYGCSISSDKNGTVVTITQPAE